MNKLIKDGKVGVLYSPGYGAGWYTWNYEFPEIIFDPKLIELVEELNTVRYRKVRFEQITKLMEDYIDKTYPDLFIGGMNQLQVKWIPEGTKFRIDEYDGSESLILQDEEHWITV